MDVAVVVVVAGASVVVAWEVVGIGVGVVGFVVVGDGAVGTVGLGVAGCGSAAPAASPSETQAVTGTALSQDTATCAVWDASDDDDQFATANVNLRFIRAVNATLKDSDPGLPTRQQVEQLAEATGGYCGPEEASENILTVQERIVSVAPDDYL